MSFDADRWEAQNEAWIESEKWPWEAQSFSPWRELGKGYEDLKARAEGQAPFGSVQDGDDSVKDPDR